MHIRIAMSSQLIRDSNLEDLRMSANDSILFTIALVGFLSLLFLALGLLADFLMPRVTSRLARRWGQQRRQGRAATYR